MLNENYYLQLLNEKCNTKRWEYNNNCYKIKVNKKNHDRVMEKVSSIVDCSFFYEFEENNLYLKINKSTLESKTIKN